MQIELRIRKRASSDKDPLYSPALVMRHADSVLKCYAVSLSMVLSFAAGIVLFQYKVPITYNLASRDTLTDADYCRSLGLRKPPRRVHSRVRVDLDVCA